MSPLPSMLLALNDVLPTVLATEQREKWEREKDHYSSESILQSALAHRRQIFSDMKIDSGPSVFSFNLSIWNSPRLIQRLRCSCLLEMVALVSASSELRMTPSRSGCVFLTLLSHAVGTNKGLIQTQVPLIKLQNKTSLNTHPKFKGK